LKIASNLILTRRLFIIYRDLQPLKSGSGETRELAGGEVKVECDTNVVEGIVVAEATEVRGRGNTLRVERL
jgi:hypothetical protein